MARDEAAPAAVLGGGSMETLTLPPRKLLLPGADPCLGGGGAPGGAATAVPGVDALPERAVAAVPGFDALPERGGCGGS